MKTLRLTLLVGVVLCVPRPLRSATVIVTDASDVLHDAGGCAETGSGLCTLRDAITFANVNVGADEIHFAIPGDGVHAITFADLYFPLVTDPLTIDGYTQPGSSANTGGVGSGDNAVLLIRVPGLSFLGGPHTVRGLVLLGGLFLGNGPDFDHLHHVSIEGNFIGTDPAGMTLAGDGGIGINGPCLFVEIGGDLPASKNVIVTGPGFPRIYAHGNHHEIRGNFIGVNAAGTEALGSGTYGVQVIGHEDEAGEPFCGERADGTLIGGSSAASRNIISGNGVGIAAGETNEQHYVSVGIQGNYIGTDVTGTVAIPNGRGVELNAGGGVGGPLPSQGNLISGNLEAGIFVSELTIPYVRGNVIGTDFSGAKALGNGGPGVYVLGTPFGYGIPMSNNVIAFNGAVDPVGGGIVIGSTFDGTIVDYPIQQNRIFSNTSDGSIPNRGLGIDLGRDGVSEIHDCNVTPEMHFENTPVLTEASTDGSGVVIRGHLTSPSDTVRRVEFYANDECDPSGHGEGKDFLGSTDVTLDRSCHADIEVSLPTPILAGRFVTATATEVTGGLPTGTTSEFSACQVVTQPGLGILGIVPSSGPPTGGAAFTISGMGFEAISTPTIGGMAPQGVVVTAPSRVEGSSPGLAPGTLNDVVVTNPDHSAAVLLKGWLSDFDDVPSSHLFHGAVERIFRAAITVGCEEGSYCPADGVTRDQMAVFLARTLIGGGSNLPEMGTVAGDPYRCNDGSGISLYTDVLAYGPYCRAVHYLAAQKVTVGCSPTAYCPQLPVNREGMAVFVARALVTPAGGSAVPESYGPDPGTGRSYSCSAAAPSLHFTDVPASDPSCKHVHYLWARGIVGGCGPTSYCPSSGVTRGEMAKFLANAFLNSNP